MTAPAHLPLPDDEFARLATLHDYHILDTEPDQHLIQLMQLAAHLYSVPIALVNITDKDRQWAMASVGLHVKEAPREGSFTAQAVLEPNGYLIVEDATQDSRFVHSPYVAGPEHFRFFAGITLRAPNGHVLGALCLIDTEPRKMAVHELRHLKELASAVVTALSLHRTLFELKAMASADPLTGLANRAMLELVASRAVTQAIDGEYSCSMLCVDMDKLRTINDLFGQTGGDLLIHGAADRLRRILREGDLLARIGGDTFAVLIPRMTVVAEAEMMADRILRQLGEPFVIGGHPVPVRPSVGIATCPADATKASELLRCADAALSRAKREGRGRVWRYEAGMEEALSARRALERDLRRAVEDRSFELLYQPIVTTATGVVCGFEALIRWRRPDQGLVSPAEFIPMAESAGLIRRIDEWVLRTACAEAAGWSHPVRVAVNISPASFASGHLPALVRDALRTTGLAADRLELELTERTVLEHTDEARADTTHIKEMGVRLSLDDFGTGYASLGYLEAFPLDKLKLDRSFVNGLGERPRAEAIARSVLGLGHALGMSICAEGVETPGQLAFLRAHGCDQVQGFLLGRPGPVDERTLTTVVGIWPDYPAQAGAAILAPVTRSG